VLVGILLATERSKWVFGNAFGLAFLVAEVNLLDMTIGMGTYLNLFYFTAVGVMIPLVVFFILLAN
jgi:hypothetical protein